MGLDLDLLVAQQLHSILFPYPWMLQKLDVPVVLDVIYCIICGKVKSTLGKWRSFTSHIYYWVTYPLICH